MTSQTLADFASQATKGRTGRRLAPSSFSRAPKDHINMGTLHNMISGVPPSIGPGTRMSDPYVFVVFWAPIQLVLGLVSLWWSAIGP